MYSIECPQVCLLFVFAGEGEGKYSSVTPTLCNLLLKIKLEGGGGASEESNCQISHKTRTVLHLCNDYKYRVIIIMIASLYNANKYRMIY